LANIGVLFLGMASRNATAGAVPEAPELRETMIGLMQLGLAFFVAFTTWNLASALKIKWAWLAAILSLFSIIGLLVLFNINK